MRDINKIIVHCSDSVWGNLEEIRKWHTEPPRSWSDVGYHFVIENCYPTWYSYKKNMPVLGNDGSIREGREIERQGAHAAGENDDSIGICLVGDNLFTGRQIESLCFLLENLCYDFDLTSDDIYGHRNFSPKECPNIDTEWLRELYNNYVSETN